jgi:hypothetical protein
MTAPAVDVRESPQQQGELFHWVCPCDYDVALCGEPVGGQRFGLPESDPVCVVCDWLFEAPCPRCGSVI